MQINANKLDVRLHFLLNAIQFISPHRPDLVYSNAKFVISVENVDDVFLQEKHQGPCSPYRHIIIILAPLSSSIIVFFLLPLSPSMVPLSSGLKPFPEGSGEQGRMGEEEGAAGGIDV